MSEGYLKNVLFLRNSAGNYGGGISVDGPEASLSLVGNVTFEANEARGGGGVSFGFTKLINVTDAMFLNNRHVSLIAFLNYRLIVWFRASFGGGGVASSFAQYRVSLAIFQDVTFEGNQAPIGGAVHSQLNVHTSDKGRPRLEFNENLVEPSITMANVAFMKNNASEGGSVYFDGIPALLERIIMQENNATENGGALKIIGGSVIKIENGVFSSNKATSGGGLVIDEQSMLHCVTCSIQNNVAEENGGGVYVTAQLYHVQPVAFQCDACNFTDNTASMGGNFTYQRLSCKRLICRWIAYWIHDESIGRRLICFERDSVHQQHWRNRWRCHYGGTSDQHLVLVLLQFQQCQ